MVFSLAGGAGKLVEPPSFAIPTMETWTTGQLTGSRDYMLSYDRYSPTRFVYAPADFIGVNALNCKITY